MFYKQTRELTGNRGYFFFCLFNPGDEGFSALKFRLKSLGKIGVPYSKHDETKGEKNKENEPKKTAMTEMPRTVCNER